MQDPKQPHTHAVGATITIQACPVLGTPSAPAEVVQQTYYGYLVRDKTGWTGPVSFSGHPLQLQY